MPERRRGGMVSRYRTRVIVVAVVCLSAVAARTEGLRLHEIQVIGSHNSYHVRPAEPGFSLAKQAYPEAAAWDYSHAPLDVQLDRGVRSFELDINNIEQCRGCEWRFLCGGGCPVHRVSVNSNPSSGVEVRQYASDITCATSQGILSRLLWKLIDEPQEAPFQTAPGNGNFVPSGRATPSIK